MGLPLNIARRYLFAKKSHNVINVISAISAIGMAIGTAALILILSVYNGFDDLVRKNLSDLDPDILISASEGKFFDAEDPVFDRLAGDSRISGIHCVLQDNIFINYDGRQGIALAKGVDGGYEGRDELAGHITEGEFKFHDGEIPMCVLGSSLSHSLGVHTWFVQPLELFYPRRGATISTVNPSASLESAKVWPAGVLSISSDIDAELILVPYDTARSLFGVDDGKVSAIEITLADGVNAARFADSLDLGGGYTVKDRYRQHPAIYKMMRYEKLAIYLILIFVVIIVAFNIFGSMSMLIIEKKDDMATLRALGANDGMVRRIFVLEGWLISLSGLIVGLVAGVALALLQQKFGFVKMPAGFMVQSYPVSLKALDVLWTAIGVAVIGITVSISSVPKTR